MTVQVLIENLNTTSPNITWNNSKKNVPMGQVNKIIIVKKRTNYLRKYKT